MSNITETLFGKPEKDSTTRETMRDIIGNDTDSSFIICNGEGPTLTAMAKAGYFHAHGTPITFPKFTDVGDFYVEVESSATAGEDGEKVEIIPADAVTKAFDLHWLAVDDISATKRILVTLWAGEEDEEEAIWSGPVARSTSQSREGDKAIHVPQIAAGTRISVSIAGNTSGAVTAWVAVDGHLYDDTPAT
jgi:hypothetical protein